MITFIYDENNLLYRNKKNKKGDKMKTEKLDQKKVREMNCKIYQMLEKVWMNAESFSDRDIEHFTFVLTDQIREIGGM